MISRNAGRAGLSVPIPRRSGGNARLACPGSRNEVSRRGGQSRDQRRDEGRRGQAAAVWLSADWRDAGTQRYDHEPQETLSALNRREAGCPAAKGPQAGPWLADADAGGAETR
jgi:hypothetical protein